MERSFPYEVIKEFNLEQRGMSEPEQISEKQYEQMIVDQLEENFSCN